MLIQRPARLESCTIRHHSPEKKTPAHAANPAGRIDAPLWVLRHGIFASVADKERTVLPHLSFMENYASSGAVSGFDDGVYFINRTHWSLFRVK